MSNDTATTDNTMAEVLARLDTLEKQARRVGEFKEEMRDSLGKVRNLDREIDKKVDDFITNTNNALMMMQQGIARTEARVNAQWNTMNTLIEFIKDWIAQPTPMTETEFVERLMTCGRRLFTAATEHHRSERARVKREQAEGKEPTPIRRQPHVTVADRVATAVLEDVSAEIMRLEAEDKEGK